MKEFSFYELSSGLAKLWDTIANKEEGKVHLDQEPEMLRNVMEVNAPRIEEEVPVREDALVVADKNEPKF